MMWFKMLKLEDSKLIGFWNDRQDTYPNFPMPEPNKPNYNKAKMMEYLSHPYSAVVKKYRGVSNCRLCENNWEKVKEDDNKGLPMQRQIHPMGTKTFSDGVYMYPEGLKHYVEIHEIELPEHFVNHVESHGYDPINSWVDNYNMNEGQAKQLIEMSDGPNSIHNVLDGMVREGLGSEQDVAFGGETR